MLIDLYQYAQDHALVARAGFQNKSIKAYVVLSAAGEFLGVTVLEKGTTTYAPDIGSAANGTRYCNFLVEKAKIPLCIAEPKDKNVATKHQFFLSMLDAGAAAEEKFAILASALREDTVREKIIQELEAGKIKPADPIGFRVDGQALERSERYLGWWSQFRKMFAAEASGDQVRCMISGELTTPLATVPTIKGLFVVGGHTKGDAFLCFDKDAFQSYGFKQSANAPVSEEAMTAVNAALNDLIKKAPILGGAKILHWYAGETPEEIDLLGDALEGIWPTEEETIADTEDPVQAEKAALLEAKQLLLSVYKGERGVRPTARYYVLPLSGVNGRVMPRGWFEGDLYELYRNLDQWFEDLRLVRCTGKGTTPPPKLWLVFTRLLKPGGDPGKASERMDKELANLSIRILNAIVQNTLLPDEVASRCLRYIRSSILETPEEDSKKPSFEMESLAFQILKAWLVRRQRNRKDAVIMGETLQTSATPAYYCGCMMAIYAAIQKEAMKDVNVGVAERYYTAASTTPAFVFGKLAQMSIHHLAKLDSERPGRALQMRKLLEEVTTRLDTAQIPKMLTMEQQTEFALGFYQQRAAVYAGKD